jgi:protein phosphatase
MVSQDWFVAVVVTVATTLVVYLVGRRLNLGGAQAKLDSPKEASVAASTAATAAGESVSSRQKSSPVTPPSGRSKKRAPAPPKPVREAAAVARVDHEDDADVDPTRIGAKAAEPSAPQTYSPKIRRIVFDAEVPENEPRTSQVLVHARAQTDTGRRRKRNEDSLLVLEAEGVFVIADGMGGYKGGELASKTAVATIEAAYKARSFDGPPHNGVPSDATDLARAIQMANNAILAAAKLQPDLAGMGTTVCAARFSADRRRLYIGHVGDSRCYRLRNDVFTQMTADHTMADLGVTGPESAQLSRAVGVWPTVPIDIIMAAPRLGDVYLLCSDGLTKMLKNDAIGSVVRSDEDPQAAVERLVASANARGGKDNITVILVRVISPGWTPAPAADPSPPTNTTPPE